MNELARLAARTQRMADGLEALPAALVKATADVVQKSIERKIGQDAPHRRVAGGSVGVRQTTIRSGKNPAILMRARGALHLLANPTGQHLILPKGSGSAKTRRARLANYSGAIGPGVHPLRTPYGPKYKVNHPGTRGKDTWRKGVDEARPLIATGMQTAVEGEIRRVLK
jgi:hypothetical protein